jgi:hypothetical protein
MVIGDITWLDDWESLVRQGKAEALNERGDVVQLVQEKQVSTLALTQSILDDLEKVSYKDEHLKKFWDVKKNFVGQRIDLQFTELTKKIRQELFTETWQSAYGNQKKTPPIEQFLT